jgi:hypothetical protein
MDLIEIIVTTTNEEMGWYREDALCKKVENVKIVKEDPAYKNLLLEICNSGRYNGFDFDNTTAFNVRNNFLYRINEN